MDAYEIREQRCEDGDYDEGIDWENVLLSENCPVCTGPAHSLGQLGRLLHFRCRDCGMDFNTAA